MKKRLFAMIVMLLWFLSVGAVAAATKPSDVAAIDFRGKQITLKRPAARIVCLIESALSGLYMLGQEHRLVGVSRNVYQGGVFKYYAALDRRIRDKSLPTPGNWDFVNIESVVALKPDLVIIWANQIESIASLEERSIPVYGVFLKQKEDVYKEMTDLGLLTGSLKRAEELIDYTRNEIKRFQNRVRSIPEPKRQRVYYMWAQGNLETSCGGSTVDDLIQLAGGRNVCGNISSEHLVANMETIIGWNPELIVMWYNEKKGPVDIISDPQWRNIRAVTSGRVHELPEIFLCDLWTLKFHFAVKMVAKWAYPDLFRDVDLEKERARMLSRLYGNRLRGI
jgi:iron complex transport system substrate-binding protein